MPPPLAVTLAATIAALAVAALTVREYRPTARLAAAGALGAIVIDVGVPVTVLLTAPARTTALAVATAASLARLAWTTTRLPPLWAATRRLGAGSRTLQRSRGTR